jgi:hypothetical protein
MRILAGKTRSGSRNGHIDRTGSKISSAQQSERKKKVTDLDDPSVGSGESKGGAIGIAVLAGTDA